MTRIQYEPSRLHILKGAAKYNFQDNRLVPTFTYQSAEHPDLKRIRAELKLDSIAGKGDELTKIFNPVESKYNAETWDMVKEIEYVELLPLDALEQTPQRTEEVNNKTGVKFVYYKTNNPNLFWTKPQ